MQNCREKQGEIRRSSSIALISHASKVMLKILQARLQQYMNQELPDVQAGVRNGRGTRGQIDSIGLCFHQQSHPQLDGVFALAPPLHSFWSYFSTLLQ